MHVGGGAYVDDIIHQSEAATRQSASLSKTAQHAKDSVPSGVQKQKLVEMSVFVPIRSPESNIRMHPHDVEGYHDYHTAMQSGRYHPLMPPALSLPPQSHFSLRRCRQLTGVAHQNWMQPDQLITGVPAGLEPDSNITFRVAAANRVGRGAFSCAVELKIRVPQKHEFQRAEELFYASEQDKFKAMLAISHTTKATKTCFGLRAPLPVESHEFNDSRTDYASEQDEFKAMLATSHTTKATKACFGLLEPLPVESHEFNDSRTDLPSRKRFVLEATPQLVDKWAVGHVPKILIEGPPHDDPQHAREQVKTIKEFAAEAWRDPKLRGLFYFAVIFFVLIYFTYHGWEQGHEPPPQ